MESIDESRIIRVPQLKPIRRVKRFETFKDLLKDAARRYGEKPAFIIKTKKAEGEAPAEYKKVSFRGLIRDITDLGTEFMKMGFLGKRVAIIGKNRYEWMLGYYAQLSGLGIVIPLDSGLTIEELTLSLERAGADILIFDPERKDLVKSLEKNPSCKVKTFICMDMAEGYDGIPAIIKRGRGALPSEKKRFSKLSVDGRALSVILFTSGTSGLAKAVMLSQYNICSDIWSVCSVADFKSDDVNMAFLPYHHSYGSTGQTMLTYAGMTTVYCDGLKYVQRNMKEYGVSYFVGVPLILEAMHRKIILEVKKSGREKLFREGLSASERLEKVLGTASIRFKRKIFKEVIDKLGGRLRSVISGASALDPEVDRDFGDMGITVLQGFGLTETSPVLTAEHPKIRKSGSVGRAVPGVDLAILDPNAEGIGELIAKGDSVMLGYYENPAATSEVMEGGWLHTGDLASLEDGFLFIRGRVKNVIVLKNGKNVYPEEIESLISSLSYVKDSLVYASPKRAGGDPLDVALSVKIVYDPEIMKTARGAVYQREVEDAVTKDLDALNAQLPAYKRIYRHELTTVPMDKTTTGKIKRYKQ